MRFALDQNHKRIEAIDASRNGIYFCPLCKQQLLCKKGEKIPPHFSHKKSKCIDDWAYKDANTKWHNKIQNFFPISSQDIIIQNAKTNEKHFADLLFRPPNEKKVIIEILYDSLARAEFEYRNKYFLNAGYKVVWLFNFAKHISKGILAKVNSDESTHTYKWEMPYGLFSTIDFSINGYNKDFSIYIDFGESKVENEFHLNKLVATNETQDLKCNMTEFKVNHTKPLILKKYMDLNFVLGLFDKSAFSNNQIDDAKKKLYELSSLYCFSITNKYKGYKGHKPQEYVCPKTDKFGLDLLNGCKSCEYCGLIVQEGIQAQVSCTYPFSLSNLDLETKIIKKYEYK